MVFFFSAFVPCLFQLLVFNMADSTLSFFFGEQNPHYLETSGAQRNHYDFPNDRLPISLFIYFLAFSPMVL